MDLSALAVSEKLKPLAVTSLLVVIPLDDTAELHHPYELPCLNFRKFCFAQGV